ncbi:MAG: hypothetical protein FJ276_26730, partial [Planctomycetes bacterium]|nr:hypothetical protein [Planctomycetota bacterium]
MATGTAEPSSRLEPAAPPTGPGQDVQQFIEQRLASTRRRIKLVDLGSFSMVMLGGVLAYLLAVVLLDHWLVELGIIGRGIALAVLLLGSAYFAALFLLPMLLRHINPVYAARAIEKHNPTLKNSLVNFLTFRGESSRGDQLVSRALQQRAALDLHQVDVALAVDQSRLIFIGYAVVALMVVFAAYVILSPKNAFQTLRRVAVPWADIARPSRIAISDVRPGDKVVIFGDQLTIRATVEGHHSDEIVSVVYSTHDRQIVDRALPMNRPENLRHFECTFPPEPTGIQQNVSYRIEVRKRKTTGRDVNESVPHAVVARTTDFRLDVLPVPTILVDQLEYQYPPYTLHTAFPGEIREPKKIVKNQGTIQAVEGTRVTIRAKANQQIQSAFIEFFEQDPPAGPGTRKPMEANGQLAEYSFQLTRNRESGSSDYACYQLSFISKDNTRSQKPISHKILVEADLPPVVEFLDPVDSHIEIPANRQQRIQIRAVDPDFGLSRVTLRAVVGSEELPTTTLLDDPQGSTGQFVLNHDFSPQQLGLQAGNLVALRAVAEDNRPDPNSTQTPVLHITILPPDTSTAPTTEDAQLNETPPPPTPENDP